MTVLLKMTRAQAAQNIVKCKQARVPGTQYSGAMVDAEELVDALEALGVVKFDPPATQESRR